MPRVRVLAPSPEPIFHADLADFGKVRDREGAIASTRGACAPQKFAVREIRVICRYLFPR